jgi:hypothetical protein
MHRYRKILLFLLIVILVIQFIQPKKNTSTGLGENDISKAYVIPERIHQTLTQKCYDCHSNHTKYPWYFHIQPIGWWFAAHIYEGKSHLNFSEFKTYQADKAKAKLEEIAEMVQERGMPVRGYVIFQPHSEITTEDEEQIHLWINSVMVAAAQ